MPAHASGYMGRGGMNGTSYQGKTSNDSRARLKKAHAVDPHRHRREKRSIKRFLVREQGRDTVPPRAAPGRENGDIPYPIARHRS